ncbi:MAG: hypothetical protein SFY56_03570 [Bacteroidota bacterium]|nr:hypothetical protein [Bacteroidota bacterium]
MKISTLALSALISFSSNAIAQERPARFKEKDTTTKLKTNKGDDKPINDSTSKNKNNSIDSTLNAKPKRHSGRYCPGCGMG